MVNKMIHEFLDVDFLTQMLHAEHENKTYKTMYLLIFTVTYPNKGKI